jgi:hypothetical protein
MPLTDTALDAMADHLASIAAQVSLHTADPGSTGANETTAGRQTPTWAASSGGVLSLSAADDFTGGAASGPCTYCGLWEADGLTFLGGFALTGDQTFNANGEYTLTDLTITGTAS